jgi:hypothetical protein
LCCGLKIGANARNRSRSRIAAISQIEYKAWIAKHFSAESSGWRVIPTKKIFYLSEQMHLL